MTWVWVSLANSLKAGTCPEDMQLIFVGPACRALVLDQWRASVPCSSYHCLLLCSPASCHPQLTCVRPLHNSDRANANDDQQQPVDRRTSASGGLMLRLAGTSASSKGSYVTLHGKQHV